MTKEDKELLLKDLCERLYYGVVVNLPHPYEEFKAYVKAINPERGIVYYEKYGVKNSPLFDTSIWKVKPYLRPMSSMTEEERSDLFMHVLDGPIIYDEDDNIIVGFECNTFEQFASLENWLNSHHFDYRGLIEKGLAMAVTEENNPYKK